MTFLTVNLIRIDSYCDRFIPGASTITNLVNLVEKTIFKGCCAAKTLKDNLYFSHVDEKPFWLCLALIIPIFGQIVAFIYYRRVSANNQEALDFLGEELLEGEHNPALVSQHVKQSIHDSYGKRNEELETSLVTFRELTRIEKPSTKEIEQINKCWDSIQLTLLVCSRDQNKNLPLNNPPFTRILQELSEKRKEAMQLRRSFYARFLKTLSKEEVIAEVQTQYDNNFPPYLRERKVFNQDTTLVFAELKEFVQKIQANSPNSYLLRLIELQEIILRLDEIIKSESDN